MNRDTAIGAGVRDGGRSKHAGKVIAVAIVAGTHDHMSWLNRRSQCRDIGIRAAVMRAHQDIALWQTRQQLQLAVSFKVARKTDAATAIFQNCRNTGLIVRQPGLWFRGGLQKRNVQIIARK